MSEKPSTSLANLTGEILEAAASEQTENGLTPDFAHLSEWEDAEQEHVTGLILDSRLLRMSLETGMELLKKHGGASRYSVLVMMLSEGIRLGWHTRGMVDGAGEIEKVYQAKTENGKDELK